LKEKILIGEIKERAPGNALGSVFSDEFFLWILSGPASHLGRIVRVIANAPHVWAEGDLQDTAKDLGDASLS
jgi:hypothetical protein